MPDSWVAKPEPRFCVDCRHVGANKDDVPICTRPHDADLVTGVVRQGGWLCAVERYHAHLPVAPEFFVAACGPRGRFFEKKLESLFVAVPTEAS